MKHWAALWKAAAKRWRMKAKLWTRYANKNAGAAFANAKLAHKARERAAGRVRVVVETDCFNPLIRCVRADGPVVVIVRPAGGTPDQVYGDGGLPVEPLGVVDGEARFEVEEAT